MTKPIQKTQDQIRSLIQLLKSMKGEDGRIFIGGFYDDVLPPAPSERGVLERIGFDEGAFRQDLGLKALDQSPERILRKVEVYIKAIRTTTALLFSLAQNPKAG